MLYNIMCHVQNNILQSPYKIYTCVYGPKFSANKHNMEVFSESKAAHLELIIYPAFEKSLSNGVFVADTQNHLRAIYAIAGKRSQFCFHHSNTLTSIHKWSRPLYVHVHFPFCFFLIGHSGLLCWLAEHVTYKFSKASPWFLRRRLPVSIFSEPASG